MRTIFELSLIPVIAALSGCHSKVDQTTEVPAAKAAGEHITLPPGSPQERSVTVAVAQPCEASVRRLNGRLVWDDDVTVRVFTPFSGRVVKITSEVGQKVERGQPLASIASPDYGQAQAEAHRAQSDFLLAERNLARIKELYEHGAAAQKDLHAAEADFERSQSEKQRATARLAIYGANIESLDQVYELKSPLSGIVVEKNINPGQEVRPDQMLANAPQFFSPLFVVTDPNRLWIQVDATEQDLPRLQAGQELLLHTRAYPEMVFTGKVELISAALDPATRTIKIRGSVQNPQQLLKAEMFVNVELSTKAETISGLDVPAKAVFFRSDKHFVFLEAAVGRYERRQVRVGAEHDGKILVLDGLQAGQKVVTEGSLLLDQMLQTGAGSS